MLAHCVVRAENSDTVADSFVLPEKPKPARALERYPTRWKHAFEALVWSKKLAIELRGVLLTILRVSDILGRVWWGQSALAELAGCSDRTLRRFLPVLVQQGFLRLERMTFDSLTKLQNALGLPPPERSDDGRAPNLMTLLVEGKPACEVDFAQGRSTRRTHEEDGRDEPRPGIARVVPHGPVVQGEPRTKASDIPPDKVADDLLGSAFLTRSVGEDLTRATHPTFEVDAQEHKTPPSTFSGHSTEEKAWKALNAAYDTQYCRVYRIRPTNKLVSRDDQQALTDCLVESVDVFEARLHERRVQIEKLAVEPLEMLANEALRAWFDTPGANDYLRRVSHRMRALRADLPYRLRKAMEAQVERLKPKPEPRRLIAPDDAEVSRDKPPLRSRVADGARKLMERLSLPIAHVTRPSFV